MQENKEKILQLFEFRIPYYVGPLGRNEEGTEGKFTWAVRKITRRFTHGILKM